MFVRATTADNDVPVTSRAASVRNPARLASGNAIPARLEVHVYVEVPTAAMPRRAGVLKIAAEHNSRKLAEVNHLSPLDRERRPVFVARDEDGDRIRD
jgi:hypothetical protein|tara:strand:+ start:74 stop:367 length:294 start_codon:yes stop_codon:yes gene_type:complete